MCVCLTPTIPNAPRPPVDAHTIFRVGSVTKLVTTLMLFKLRDAGMLSLDDPIHVHDSLPSCEC